MKTLQEVQQFLIDYKPTCQQEEKDKQVILQYIHDFPNLLTRDNEYAHITSSSFIFNKERTKTLFIYHNIFNSWTWTGGHCDGDADLIGVALREAKEESNLDCKPITQAAVAVDILPVWGHIKRGKWVSAHQHINFTFIFEADENAELKHKPDENSGVKWIPIDEVEKYSTEPDMYPTYRKIIKNAKEIFAKENNK